MARRLVVLLAVALPVAGCGTAERASAPVRLASARGHHVPKVPKRRLVRRAERLCRRWHSSHWTHPPVFDAGDPLGSMRRAISFARRVVVVERRGYRRFHALGVPPRGRARRRWVGFLSQYRATIDHLDELQAGAAALDVAFMRGALRRLDKAASAAERRGRRLGLRACLA